MKYRCVKDFGIIKEGMVADIRKNGEYYFIEVNRQTNLICPCKSIDLSYYFQPIKEQDECTVTRDKLDESMNNIRDLAKEYLDDKIRAMSSLCASAGDFAMVTKEPTKEILKGWDIIRLAHEGKLKEGTIITNIILDDIYIYDDKFIKDKDGDIDVELYKFIGYEFEIEEPKRLVDFNTALKEKLNIRHKDWDKSVKATTVQNVCVEFSKCTHEEIADMLTGECWEAES